MCSPHRFNVVPAGRRSGKTEIAKRRLWLALLKGSAFGPPRLFAAAPTRDQAKKIYWDDLKRMAPRFMLDGEPRESDLIIRVQGGGELHVVGMDKPERIEGQPWDGGVLDEYANMKEEAWAANVRPALSDRRGWCDLIGVPEGRNHYYEKWLAAKEMMATAGDASEWGAFTWLSSSVLPESEVDAARRDLDPRTYRQEYEASFEGYSGVVYYAFDRAFNVRPCEYRPELPLHVGMDFNINPMSATVHQLHGDGAAAVDHQVAEVVLDTSNTDEMADHLMRVYSRGGDVSHITVYPDPAGHQRRTSAQGRTDISILRSRGFNVVALSSHPKVRDRVNCGNARYCNAAGERRSFIDPSCRLTIQAAERLVYGQDGEPDKTGGFDHLMDARTYFQFTRWGSGGARRVTVHKAA